MTYRDFLEEAYQAVWREAPPVMEISRVEQWTRSIGELLLHMPPELQRRWEEQYATIISMKYGHIPRDIARVCVRHGLNQAEAAWPKFTGKVAR